MKSGDSIDEGSRLSHNSSIFFAWTPSHLQISEHRDSIRRSHLESFVFFLSFASFSPFRWCFSFFRCSLFNFCYLTINVLLHFNSCHQSSFPSNAQRPLSAGSYIIVCGFNTSAYSRDTMA